ncbi:hypothetical protein FGU65_06030 [Methanoculleus sp. FWC-SCC1]|uniref:Uncharacterized protein n=1 Tax=Methanoculleus frigidifontis TaxID=2584085 RepID=A0ABT8M934_9EURY|nr:hypothetical protein [Methanoculleus sp. FWC-SCC1]MDN7024450.1 hypothetical protein [Methanoculleus sp. FWC-SCC1]
MSKKCAALCILILGVAIGAAGCLGDGFSFGDAVYADDALTIGIESSRDVAGAVMQVGVTEMAGFSQNEISTEAVYVDLRQGMHEYTYAIGLAPGEYRVYLLLFVDGERVASVIRDVEV